MKSKKEIEKSIEALQKEIERLNEEKNNLFSEGDLLLVTAKESWSKYTYAFRVKHVGETHLYGVYMDEDGRHCPATFTFMNNIFTRISI